MSYAFKTAQGAWIEIVGDTLLPGFGEDGAAVLVSPGFVASWNDATRAARAVVAVAETAAPTDPTVTVTGSTVADVAGVPTRAWQTASKLLADLKAERTAAADAWYQTLRHAPMSWDFAAIAGKDDAGAGTGAAGVQTLQMSDDDQSNWQAVTIAAQLAVAGGQGAAILPLKTTANVWVQTTNAQVLQVMALGDGVQPGAYARAFAMLQRVGAIKLAIARAASKAAVAAIDVTAGYPA